MNNPPFVFHISVSLHQGGNGRGHDKLAMNPTGQTRFSALRVNLGWIV